MKAQDRIFEAYLNGMGEAFGEKVRKRIHWICENTKGKQVLDVGCSQGIVDILLGRESKQVLAIDVLEDSIAYAKEKLAGEQELVRKNVEFAHASFLDIDLKDSKYDTIIMTEVLEHLIDPNAFIDKALEHLNETGTLIITVPFGINDYFDHKRTYYCEGVLKLLRGKITVKTVEFMGKWIGFVCVKEQQYVEQNIKGLLEQMEVSFYEIERELITQRDKAQKQLKEQLCTIEHLKVDSNNKEKYNRENENKLKSYISEIETYRIQKEQYESQIATYNKDIKAYEAVILKYNSNTSSKKTITPEGLEEILKDYKCHRDEILNKSIYYLDEIENLLDEKENLKEKRDYLLNRTEILYTNNQQLVEELRTLKTNYKALSNSKLGKITLKFWRLKNRIKNKKKRG